MFWVITFYEMFMLKQLSSRCSNNLTENTDQVMFSGDIYYTDH